MVDPSQTAYTYHSHLTHPCRKKTWIILQHLHKTLHLLKYQNSDSLSSFFSGDKWLVSCLGVLHLSKGLFYRVVPADQGFGSSGEPPGSPTAEYAGVFRFRLWWCGAWVEVLVDDRLPAIHGRLAFVQSRHSDQFWPALLEKAYAKWVALLEPPEPETGYQHLFVSQRSTRVANLSLCSSLLCCGD